eukprot:TRINITY_DN3055_c0_g1_i1.p1 TRINITY_DN3055_c0_g1~~TRINITY_DN3055_c0_g1_i1.p1  ORF type:complete len:197 (+),score=34.88 TRINITY_DN3055_c0_g1_i1:121-711(+)
MQNTIQNVQNTEFYTRRDLFGGGMSVMLPRRFADVSELRQVPDNQEVFVDVNTDQSIIIELLALEENVPNSESIKYFFDDLAESNDAKEGATIIQTITLDENKVPLFGKDIHKSALLGDQYVSKFNEQSKNKIQLYMANIRLPQVTTDILITLNTPVYISTQSSSKVSVDATAQNSEQVFMGILKSIEVKSWSLFN